MNQKRTFLDRLTGVSRVDNESNPASALNMRKRQQKPTPVIKQTDQMRQHLERVFKTQKVFGRGWK